MPGGRPTKYNKNDHPKRAYDLCLLGATDEELARVFGVQQKTIDNWKQRHPEFLRSIKAAKDQADGEVARALYRMATGYVHTVQKPVVVSKGEKIGSEVEVAEYEERLAPNPTSMIFWLKNRQPKQWRDKQEHEHAGPDGGAIPLEAKVTFVKPDTSES